MLLMQNLGIRVAATLFVGCGLSLLIYQQKHDVVKLLEKIPKEEQLELEIFFRSLISDEDGCYVLYGNKPVALLTYADWEEIDQEMFYRGFFDFFSPQEKGFKIWQKYQHLFPLKTYALVKTRGSFPKYQADVFLIHKKRLLNVLKQNFYEFKGVFSQFESPNQLLEAILQYPSILEQICVNRNDELLGIILGFGKENAAYFDRKWEIKSFLFPRLYRLGKSYHPLKKPVPRPGYATLEDELKALEAKSGDIIIPEKCFLTFTLHLPLGYDVDATVTDVPGLRKKYKQQQYKATKAYQNGSFLEITLREMMR